MRHRPHLCDELSECVLLGKHVENVISLAYNFLNPVVFQEAWISHPVCMAVPLHFVSKVFQIPEAKATMPARIWQDDVCFSSMVVECGAMSIHAYCSPPARLVHKKFEGVKVIAHLQVKRGWDVVAPPQKIDCVCTWYLIRVRHDHKVTILDTRFGENAAHHVPLLLFQLKGAFSLQQVAARAEFVDDAATMMIPITVTHIDEAKAVAICSKEKGFGAACKGGVGFNDEEFGDDRGELTPADFKEVKLVVEDDGIEDATRAGAGGPTMEGAELGDGEIRSKMVDKVVEGGRGRVPDGAEKVGDMVPLEEEGAGEGKEGKKPAEEDFQIQALCKQSRSAANLHVNAEMGSVALLWRACLQVWLAYIDVSVQQTEDA